MKTIGNHFTNPTTTFKETVARARVLFVLLKFKDGRTDLSGSMGELVHISSSSSALIVQMSSYAQRRDDKDH